VYQVGNNKLYYDARTTKYQDKIQC